jgi:predicted enzyme involved in methoxymalonyl-ACP biosynthesis
MSCKVFSRRIEYFVIKYLLKNVYQNKIDFTSLNLEICKKNLYLLNFFNELLNIDLKKNNSYTISVNKFNLKTNKYIKVQK